VRAERAAAPNARRGPVGWAAGTLQAIVRRSRAERAAAPNARRGFRGMGRRRAPGWRSTLPRRFVVPGVDETRILWRNTPPTS